MLKISSWKKKKKIKNCPDSLNIYTTTILEILKTIRI